MLTDEGRQNKSAFLFNENTRDPEETRGSRLSHWPPDPPGLLPLLHPDTCGAPRSSFGELRESVGLPFPVSTSTEASSGRKVGALRGTRPPGTSEYLTIGLGLPPGGGPAWLGRGEAYLVRVGVASSRVEALWAPLTSWPCEGMTRERVTLVLLVLWALE